MAILNLGILAHVDAGKTSLTERLLFDAGAIRAIGSVDKGTTQTDTLALERARGITIKAAVASFAINGSTINLVDTPGHPDFIAEVERSLRVLDAVVLVVSAVEGIQPQTRRLARAVRAAGLPLIIFVNKIDRMGARGEALLPLLHERLHVGPLAMNRAVNAGGPEHAVVDHAFDDAAWRDRVVDVLAEANDAVIAEYDRSDGAPDPAFLRAELRAQVASGAVTPVFFGSAISGAGIDALLRGLTTWLTPPPADADAPLSGEVFKIARRPSGEKLTYARLFAGAVEVRQQVALQRWNARGERIALSARITGLDRIASGAAHNARRASAGEIAILHGLHEARIGDRLGSVGADEADTAPAGRLLPMPALESVVQPVDAGQIVQLRTALEELAEADPLIALRQRNDAGDLSVRLYGEVQKEVIGDTLLQEYGVPVTFGATSTICIERLIGSGEYVEAIGGDNPLAAGIGLRIALAPPSSGVRYERELGALPLAFYRAIEETVRESLAQGISGWDVPDCAVTLTHTAYYSPISTAADFRKLTPLVVMQALLLAGTEVCEPTEQLEIELPEDTFGAVGGALARARGTLQTSVMEGGVCRLTGIVPTAELRGLEMHIPGLTRGEGSWLASPAGYIAVTGDPPTRPHIGPDPRNRAGYLAEIVRA
ncbi:MAG: TetM/TetW/TetO/TetS family tetracycline resistance ribosomal protection protein [Thermomicrobiales bacterium]